MAKKKSTPKPTKAIPQTLETHIQAQQDAMHVAQSLLGCIITEVDDAPASEEVDNASISLKHLNRLLSQINENLDSVNVKRAMGVVS